MRWLAREERDWRLWHPWFAWHPVKTHPGWGRPTWVWLETIERSIICADAYAVADYRLPPDQSA